MTTGSTTLVVYETMYGRTRDVAQAVADGCGGGGGDVRLVEVGDLAAGLPDEVTLLVVGGPTHAFSMTRPGTRRDAGKIVAQCVDVEHRPILAADAHSSSPGGARLPPASASRCRNCASRSRMRISTPCAVGS